MILIEDLKSSLSTFRYYVRQGIIGLKLLVLLNHNKAYKIIFFTFSSTPAPPHGILMV
jgi:hypothetical protein